MYYVRKVLQGILNALADILTSMDESTHSSSEQHGSVPITKPDQKTLMGVLAYLGILIVIPFLMAKDDPFVKFHLKQGLVLVVIELAIWIIGMALSPMWMLLQIVNLATIVLAIVGIVNVVQKKQEELPVVGGFASMFKI